MSAKEEFLNTIEEDAAGQRLDVTLAQVFPQWSRGRLQQWIKSGAVTVDGDQWRARDKVSGGESVKLIVEIEDEVEEFVAEPIPVEVIHEDDDLIIVNKPARQVVHPAPGNWGGTLLNGLLHRYPELSGVPRAGIVHRLDKDTSGLLAVARTLKAHHKLVKALQRREFSREYLALVEGKPISGGTVDAPIARHHTERKRMAVQEYGKPAVTHYRINKKFAAHTLLNVKLETGRTHQIRVHMTNIRYPIVGDPVYGGRLRTAKGLSEPLVDALRLFRRQALHATRLALKHPISGEDLSWEVPVPEDFAALLVLLEEDNAR
ncbi:MAG TPA: 23S rRNA pseudouridine(1911/1915/1917) synthase RluD [Gammaproteobacteria bacterium]|nr:23S rRNA pseudouridine(1911/1915/1917) synthase RluD [Gammaproteobacteria bacterium]